MYSFYGGRPGAPFIIIATFRSIDEMNSAFALGPEYTKVHYGEHVLINTENRNDEDNGKIYRRGYGGAEYIGTIVGPAGAAPMMYMDTYSEIQNKIRNDNEDPDDYKGTYTVTNEDLVPGKNGNQYNNEISWICYPVRDENAKDTTAYVGFKIPYLVVDFEAETVETDTSSIEPMSTSNAFYKKWKIKIPRGPKGDYLDSIQVVTRNGKQWLQYTKKEWENGAWNTVTEDLGAYNVIKSISFQNGQLRVEYTNAEPFVTNLEFVTGISVGNDGQITLEYNTLAEGSTSENPIRKTVTLNSPKIKWIKSIGGNDSGEIVITYNDNSTQAIGSIQSVENFDIDTESGNIIIEYSNGTQAVIQQKFKCIDNVELDEQTGNLKINYNIGDPTTLDTRFRYIEDVNITDDGGYVYIRYNDGSEQQIVKEIQNPNDPDQMKEIPLQVRWIDNITVNDFGDLTIEYNTYAFDDNGELSDDDKELAEFKHAISSVRDIYIDEDTHKMMLETNEQDSQARDGFKIKQLIGPVNYIEDAAVDSTGALLMKFLWDPKNQGTRTYDGTDGWTYVGTVSGQGLGFQENETSITNKYLNGIINNQRELMFDLQSNRFLSKKFTGATITQCQIEVYDTTNTLIATIVSSNNNDTVITVNQDNNSIVYNNSITSELFGLHCIFENFGTTTPSNFIPVNIFIKKLDLEFALDGADDGGDSETPIDQRIEALQNSLSTLSATVGALSGVTKPIVASTTGSGITVPSQSDATLVAQIPVSPGWYVIQGLIDWPSNAKGTRQMFFSLSPNAGSANERFARLNHHAYGHQQIVWVVRFTSSQTVCLWGKQNSGSSLKTGNVGIKYMGLPYRQ